MRRLAIGIGAVAVLVLLGVVAVSSVRGRLHAPAAVTAQPAPEALAAENARLRAEVARLEAERDTRARATASPVPGPAQNPQPQVPAAPPRRQALPAPAVRVQHRPAAEPAANGFTEPQTFESISTTHQRR